MDRLVVFLFPMSNRWKGLLILGYLVVLGLGTGIAVHFLKQLRKCGPSLEQGVTSSLKSIRSIHLWECQNLPGYNRVLVGYRKKLKRHSFLNVPVTRTQCLTNNMVFLFLFCFFCQNFINYLCQRICWFLCKTFYFFFHIFLIDFSYF